MIRAGENPQLTGPAGGRLPAASRAGTPIKDATMHKAVAGSAISLGGVAEFRACRRFRHLNQRTERGVSCLSFGR